MRAVFCPICNARDRDDRRLIPFKCGIVNANEGDRTRRPPSRDYNPGVDWDSVVGISGGRAAKAEIDRDNLRRGIGERCRYRCYPSIFGKWRSAQTERNRRSAIVVCDRGSNLLCAVFCPIRDASDIDDCRLIPFKCGIVNASERYRTRRATSRNCNRAGRWIVVGTSGTSAAKAEVDRDILRGGIGKRRHHCRHPSIFGKWRSAQTERDRWWGIVICDRNRGGFSTSSTEVIGGGIGKRDRDRFATFSNRIVNWGNCDIDRAGTDRDRGRTCECGGVVGAVGSRPCDRIGDIQRGAGVARAINPERAGVKPCFGGIGVGGSDRNDGESGNRSIEQHRHVIGKEVRRR